MNWEEVKTFYDFDYKIRENKINKMDIKRINIISKNKFEIELNDDDLIIEAYSKLNDDNFDFYINGIKKDFSKEQRQQIHRYMVDMVDEDEMKLVIANDDYERIYNRLSFDDICKGYNNDKEIIINQLSSTLQTFIEYEHYEKCIIIKKLLEKTNEL